MAFGQNSTGTYNKSGNNYNRTNGAANPVGGTTGKPAASTTAVEGTRTPPLMRVSLSKPKNDKVKAIGSGVLKEAVTLPAGSYIDLYENVSQRDGEKYFTLQVKEGKPRAE